MNWSTRANWKGEQDFIVREVKNKGLVLIPDADRKPEQIFKVKWHIVRMSREFNDLGGRVVDKGQNTMDI